jgi:hypothetical protein
MCGFVFVHLVHIHREALRDELFHGVTSIVPIECVQTHSELCGGPTVPKLWFHDPHNPIDAVAYLVLIARGVDVFCRMTLFI